MRKKIDLSLYLVTDRKWATGPAFEQQVEQALCGGVTFLQLREKQMGQEEFLTQACKIKKIAEKYGVPLIINDNIEVALAAGADGVHLGQGDGSVKQARSRLGEGKIIGVSAHSVEEARAAEKAGADYLGAGAVFPTGTKSDTTRLETETLKEICTAVSIPVAAIGGISGENLKRLEGTGIAGIAVVSAILAQEDARQAAMLLREKVRQL